jgi:hypothetical protein
MPSALNGYIPLFHQIQKNNQIKITEIFWGQKMKLWMLAVYFILFYFPSKYSPKKRREILYNKYHDYH